MLKKGGGEGGLKSNLEVYAIDWENVLHEFYHLQGDLIAHGISDCAMVHDLVLLKETDKENRYSSYEKAGGFVGYFLNEIQHSDACNRENNTQRDKRGIERSEQHCLHQTTVLKGKIMLRFFIKCIDLSLCHGLLFSQVISVY